MTDNNENVELPEETEPFDKKKMKFYLAISVGFIGLVLFIMTVVDIASRPSKEEKERQQQEVSGPTLSTEESSNREVNDFASLVDNTRAQEEKKQEQAVTHAKDNPYEEKVRAERERRGYTGNRSRSAFLPEEKDPYQEAMEKWRIREAQRALMAAQSNWGTNQKVANSQPQKKPEPVITRKVLSSDEKRQAIAAKIEKTRLLRQQIMTEGYNAGIEQELAQNQLASLEKEFQNPPSNIVGYTKENQYQASTEGKYKLPVGTVIPGITAMKTISDYPGTIKGIVTQDIYDIDYQSVLIPKGSEIIIKSVRISNVNEPIQARMGYTVPWIVLPNGNKIDMSKSSGLDREGVAAMKDQVNYHFMAQFLGVAAYALVASETSYVGTGTESEATYSGDVGRGIRSQVSPIAQKYLSLVPTITIKAGQSLNIILEEEIFLEPWKNIFEDYQS